MGRPNLPSPPQDKGWPPIGLVNNNNVLMSVGGTPGWILGIHGGGWLGNDPAYITAAEPYCAWFNSQGWSAYNIDYRNGIRSLPDCLAAYDFLRGTIGPSLPIVTAGGSAGAHLALMVAAYRPVAGVIAQAPPTDLGKLPTQPAYAPGDVDPLTGSRYTYDNWIKPFFGWPYPRLWQWSPNRVARQIKGPVLMGGCTFDEFVPHAQLTTFAARRPHNTTVMLLDGADPQPPSLNFTHASVTDEALASFNSATVSLLGSVA
jgi:acetyl esterase/lipase